MNNCKRTDYSGLEKIAKQIRRDIIAMITEAKSGHPGGSLSMTDILAVLYFKQMRHNPKNPQWEERDRFILSKGHACSALYACLARAGYFPPEELLTFRKLHTRLQGHPALDKGLPGIENTSGALGQGLSFACGIALSGRLDKKNYRVYCMLGDGELDEGQVWEAVLTASHYKLDNLCAIVDYNGFQLDGKLDEIKNMAPLTAKWQSFGWQTIEIDGHNYNEIDNAFEQAKKIRGFPTAIIAHTIKGKGVSFIEGDNQWHGKAPTKEQAEKATQELL
jgi:transketolase